MSDSFKTQLQEIKTLIFKTSCDRSTLVEHLALNPDIGGSNPAVREKMAINFRPTGTNTATSEHYGL